MCARSTTRSILFVMFSAILFIPSMAGNGKDSIISKKNCIRGELFGAGGYYSINYERYVWQTSRGTFASRVGMAYLREEAAELNEWNNWDGYFFTTCHSFLFGKKRSRLETGIALTLYRSDYNAVNSDYEAESSSTTLMAGPLIGYRYFAKYNFNFGLTAYPFRTWSWYSNGFMNPDWLLSGGISVGKSF